MHILLFRLLLVLLLTRVALSDRPGDFWHQAGHEDPLPAEVIGGGVAGVAQELMCDLDGSASEVRWDVGEIGRPVGRVSA